MPRNLFKAQGTNEHTPPPVPLRIFFFPEVARHGSSTKINTLQVAKDNK
jgi:hypothetical protein